MIKFDLEKFLDDKKISRLELSQTLSVPNQTIYVIGQRGTVKPKFFRALESHFGDCSKYILKSQKRNMKKAS